MKTFVLSAVLCLFAGLSVAQPSPPHISTGPTTKVVVELGQTVCFFDGPVRSLIFVDCFIGLNQTPAFSITVDLATEPGQTESSAFGGISWTLFEPAPGQFDWTITASTLTQSGTF